MRIRMGLVVALTLGSVWAQEMTGGTPMGDMPMGDMPMSGGADTGMAGMNMPGMGALEGLSGDAFEVAFMSMMIAHHEGAVAMADWVTQRSESPDIRAAAGAVRAAQEPEIALMKGWLRDWYGVDVDENAAGAMQAEMGEMMTRMEGGENADRAFLEEMTEHHLGAVDMAQLALVKATHPALRALARDIIVTQAGEVYQYQVWLEEAR